MTSTTLTTELEAVNIVLAAAGEAPVQSISLSGLYPLDQAKACLNEASREVQSKGWTFNTEDKFPLTRNGSNEIPLPANALTFDPITYYDIDPVPRGLKMYDRQNRTYVFAKDIEGTLVSLLDWDELPQAVRHYITIVAARKMQSRMPVPQDVRRYSEEDEVHARIACGQFESQVGDHNMLTDSWSTFNVVFDRDLIR